MSIPTQMSLQGFIASAPELTFTGNGVARFYARAKLEHFRKETDGSFTELPATYHDLVMFNTTAERAYARFRSGDSFVASGYINEYEVTREGKQVLREEFVARRIGHDTVRTRYDVDRSPTRQSEAPMPVVTPPASGPTQAVGL